MTVRHIAEAGIKLIGVYFAASAIVGAGNLVASFALPPMAGFPTARDVAASSVLSLLGSLVVAGGCLFGGAALGRRFFGDAPIEAARITRRDLLVVGVALLGLSMALAGVPGIVEIAAKAAWYAEGSRQSMFWPVLRQSTDVVVNSLLALLIGTATAASAGRIASVLDTSRS